MEQLGDDLRELAARAVAVATDAGASYADARVVELTSEHLRVRNGEVEGVQGSDSTGIGVRVVADGCWGFAATSGLEPPEVDGARSQRRSPGPPSQPARWSSNASNRSRRAAMTSRSPGLTGARPSTPCPRAVGTAPYAVVASPRGPTTRAKEAAVVVDGPLRCVRSLR